MANPLSQLESDLAVFATPETDPTAGGGTATVPADGVLSAVQELFSMLEQVSGIGPAIEQLATGVNSGLTDAADALDQIAGQLQSLSTAAGSAGADASTVLTSLQNALSTAGSLVPGSANVSALQSGSQFFDQLGTLLSDLTSVAAAVTTLYQIGQELRAIGSLPTS
jgi:ABC-type transporter Mla subunit MlaD